MTDWTEQLQHVCPVCRGAKTVPVNAPPGAMFSHQRIQLCRACLGYGKVTTKRLAEVGCPEEERARVASDLLEEE